MYRTLEAWFNRHPLRMPVQIIIVGTSLLLLQIAAQWYHPYLIGIAVIIVAIGILVLPVGVVTVIRRRRPVILVCPHCGMASPNAERPFRIERFGHVDYAAVTCSHCGGGFTAGGFKNLV